MSLIDKVLIDFTKRVKEFLRNDNSNIYNDIKMQVFYLEYLLLLFKDKAFVANHCKDYDNLTIFNENHNNIIHIISAIERGCKISELLIRISSIDYDII